MHCPQLTPALPANNITIRNLSKIAVLLNESLFDGRVGCDWRKVVQRFRFIEAHQDRLRKLETSSQELCDLLQGRKLTIEDRLNIVEGIIENLRELEKLERINAALIARLCGTSVASRWIM